MIRLGALLGACLVCAAWAESPTPGLHDLSFVSHVDGSTQRYGLWVPAIHDRGESLPLVVALHGLGGDRHRFFADTAIADWAEREGWLVLSPDARGDWFYLGPGESDVFQAIDEVISRFHVDEERVYLMGHSMGGWGAWQIACAQPDRFAAIVAMAGWAPNDLLPSISHIPTLVIHGEQDSVIGIHIARSAVRVVRDSRGNLTQWEAPTYGHHPRLISTLLPEVATWLRGRSRPPLGEHLSLRTRTPRRGGQHGAEILRTLEFPRLASLEATLLPQRLAEVGTHNIAEFSLPPQWSLDHARVDGELVTLPLISPHEGVVFTRGGAHWRAVAVPEERKSPMPAQEVLALDQSIRPNMVRVAESLIKATGAEACLIPRLFNTPSLAPGPLDEDTLLDLWPQPMHVQWIGIARPEAVRRALRSGTHWLVPHLSLDNPKHLLRITFPALGDPRLPDGMWAVSTGHRTVELLHGRVEQTGELP